MLKSLSNAPSHPPWLLKDFISASLNPLSNTFFWRSPSPFEIAYTIHGLRKVHPLVFPHDDAISEHDLLQPSLHPTKSPRPPKRQS